MSEDETRRAGMNDEAGDETEAHGRASVTDEAGDEAADDDVEAHSRPGDPDDSRRSARPT